MGTSVKASNKAPVTPIDDANARYLVLGAGIAMGEMNPTNVVALVSKQAPPTSRMTLRNASSRPIPHVSLLG